ncbi:MAG TPA: HPF/RaiA family ribosome-associated protein [Bacteriovoracaceae bacterium]|nr:HPF/RaiA family ribosome-associated protein [Bacteriovoracaceae bacterium]
MQVQVHYQGLEPSPWLDQFIGRKVAKLDRYLTSAASIQVNLRFENREYVTGLAIHNSHHDYAFTSNGENLYESFSTAVEKASRSLGEERKKLKDKIHRKFFSIKRDLAY